MLLLWCEVEYEYPWLVVEAKCLEDMRKGLRKRKRELIDERISVLFRGPAKLSK